MRSFRAVIAAAIMTLYLGWAAGALGLVAFLTLGAAAAAAVILSWYFCERVFRTDGFKGGRLFIYSLGENRIESDALVVIQSGGLNLCFQTKFKR